MSSNENSLSILSKIPNESLKLKHEKCRNITEEIYKRINITFEIKKLETNTNSDLSYCSDQIDSNELSNETDLFACDKTDSISSSTDPEKPSITSEKYININNNEEPHVNKIIVAPTRRPRKRFRKRIKKRQTKISQSDTEGSSDEAAPLSRIVNIDTKCVKTQICNKSESPDNVMGVPKIIIVTKDLKSRIVKPEMRPAKKSDDKLSQWQDETYSREQNIEQTTRESFVEKISTKDHNCDVCSFSSLDSRALRHHIKKFHDDTNLKKITRSKRSSRPA